MIVLYGDGVNKPVVGNDGMVEFETGGEILPCSMEIRDKRVRYKKVDLKPHQLQIY